jgi:phosphate acetyltransferase
MLNFTERMQQKAQHLQKTLVLPEGTEPRTVKAARMIMDKKLASQITLLGRRKAVETVAADENILLDEIEILDPSNSTEREDFADEYYELRKHKGISREEAREAIAAPLKWGAMMVRKNYCDGMVAGAENSTGDVLRAAFTIVGTAPGVKYASSCFVMVMPDQKWGVEGSMIFSDCATIRDPSAEQLAEIAIAASETCKTLLEAEPVTALLSYSTKGSSSGPFVDLVLKALDIVREKRPDLRIDGELQLDAAVIPEICEKKAPESDVAGRANVLIFPNLAAGNIAYKLVQRLGGAHAYGPFLQGFAKPLSDLSRGCSVEEIVNTVAVTLARS